MLLWTLRKVMLQYMTDEAEMKNEIRKFLGVTIVLTIGLVVYVFVCCMYNTSVIHSIKQEDGIVSGIVSNGVVEITLDSGDKLIAEVNDLFYTEQQVSIYSDALGHYSFNKSDFYIGKHKIVLMVAGGVAILILYFFYMISFFNKVWIKRD